MGVERRHRAVATVVLAAVLVLAGCGSYDETSRGAASAAPRTTDTTGPQDGAETTRCTGEAHGAICVKDDGSSVVTWCIGEVDDQVCRSTTLDSDCEDTPLGEGCAAVRIDPDGSCAYTTGGDPEPRMAACPPTVEDGAPRERLAGVVVSFSDEEGFGWIRGEDGRTYFVRFFAIEMEGYKSLAAGERVTFVPGAGVGDPDPERPEDGPTPLADDVRLVEPANEAADRKG